MRVIHFSLVLFIFTSLASISLGEKKRHTQGTVPLPQDFGKEVKATPSPQPNPDSRIFPKGYRTPPKTQTAENQPKANPSAPHLPTTKAHCDQKHPIETFVQISSATSPQPGKEGVYFLSDLREVSQVFFLKSKDTWPEQITFFPDGVPYYRVSPDGKKLLAASHEDGDEQYDIYLFEAEGNRTTPLLVDRATRIESVVWGPDSKWFAYTSNERNKTDMDLYRYDLKERKSTPLVELNGLNTVSDISPDGKLILIENFRSISDGDLSLWKLDKKELSLLTKHEGKASFRDGLFSGDSQGLFYLSDAEKGISQLYFQSLSPQATRKILTASAWEVDSFHLAPDRGALVYLVNEEGYSKFDGFIVDKNGQKRKWLNVPRLKNQIAHSPAFTLKPGNRDFFFTLTASTQSPDVWAWSSDKTEALSSPYGVQWTHSTHGRIHTECFTKEKLIHYPSFDKREIPAFLFYPEGKEGPVPFIVYLHGGPESQYRPGFSKIFQYFLERGFGVLAPNVRGSTGYGRDYAELDNYKLRMNSVRDAVEGAKWLVEKGYSKAGQLAVYGGSYGGFMVLRSIEIEPDLFSAACESVGIANFVTFLENTKPYRRALREVEYGPLTDKEFLTSISPITYLNQIKTPLLIFHGAKDPRVPVTETEQMIKELQKRGIPVESKIFPDEGHGNAKLRNLMEQAKLTVYFFEKQIMKKGP